MEMGLFEAFFPYGNFQVGFGFAAMIWAIGLTKGNTSYDESLVYVPNIGEMLNRTYLRPVHTQNNSSYVITIPIIPENGTSGGLTNMTLMYSDLIQRDLLYILNGSTGGVLWRSGLEHLYLQQQTGDITPLYEMTNLSRQYLVPVKVLNGTKLCINSGFDSLTYEVFISNSTFEPERLFSIVRKELSSFTTECLLADDIDSDVVFVNSSKPFGVTLIDSEVLPNPDSGRRVIESIPNTNEMGTEFVVVTDTAAELHFVGLESSDVWIKTSQSEEYNFTIMPYRVQKLNVKGGLVLQLTSSKPIQVICLTSIQNPENTSFLNLFTVFPLESTFCNWFEISSRFSVEARVIVVTKKATDYPSLSINGSLIVRATNYSFSDYHVLEIANLPNGSHSLKVSNSAELAVFVDDGDQGRLYQVRPVNWNKCSEIYNSYSSSFPVEDNNENSTTTVTTTTTTTTTNTNVTVSSSDLSPSNVSSSFSSTPLSGNLSVNFNTTASPFTSTQKLSTNESAFLNVTTVSITTTNSTVTLEPEPMVKIRELEIGGAAPQSQINQSTSNSTLGSSGGSPSYNIFFQDVEEDDHSQEYMMAVVLSLCVAIFAVIAVISSFLLMEFISRRKQIRNTKIRPFVS